MSWNAHIWCLMGLSMLLVAVFEVAFVAKPELRPAYVGDGGEGAVHSRRVEWVAVAVPQVEWVAVETRPAG